MSSAREHFDNEQLERLQIRVRVLEELVRKAPFMRGKLIEDIALTTASLQVAHGLGRAVTGFLVLSVTPDAAVGLSTSQSIDPTKFVHLEASASCTADIWFW